MELDVWVEGITVEYEDIGSQQFFPEGHEAFYKVRDLIETGQYESGSYDVLTKFVVVPKSEVLKLVKSLYTNLDHINKRLDTLYQTIEKLPDDGMLTLVSDEFWSLS